MIAKNRGFSQDGKGTMGCVKRSEETRTEVEHQKLNSSMIKTVDGSTCLWNKIAHANGSERRSSWKKKKMPSRSPDVKRKGKSGQILRADQFFSGVGVGNAFQVSQEDFAGFVRVFRARGTRSIYRMCGKPLQTIKETLPASGTACSCVSCCRRL